MAGSLRHRHIAGDDRLEDDLPEEIPNLFLHLSGQFQIVVVHREDDPPEP